MVRGILKPTGLRIVAALFPRASPALDTRRLKNAPSGNLPHPAYNTAIFILLLVPLASGMGVCSACLAVSLIVIGVTAAVLSSPQTISLLRRQAAPKSSVKTRKI